MRRVTLPITALRPWCLLNGVSLDGALIRALGNGQGCGIVASRDSDPEGTTFITVPRELVLCEELVWELAKSDLHLRQVLEASGEWAKTARGAIIIFLLVQLTASSPDVDDKIGLPNPFTDYIKFLPDETSLPSRWSEEELHCLEGTTLQNHMKVKMSSLERQFDELREHTATVPWCEKWWWSEGKGAMTFEDLKIVDSMFRSRAMDFGEHGLSLVPVMDMANHDNEDNNIARFEIDPASRGGVLPLQWGRRVMAGYEITINYGSDRSASDMLHSYGFIEPSMEHAGSMFLSLPAFNDDPLMEAKMVGLELVPGVKFGVDPAGVVTFHSPCLWAMVVNEEDGLRIEVSQTNDGEYDLQFFFHDEPINKGDDLQPALEKDVLWDLFELRAHQVLMDLLGKVELQHRRRYRLPLEKKVPKGVAAESHAYKMSERLHELEYKLLKLVVKDLSSRILQLSQSTVVLRWLDDSLTQSKTQYDTENKVRSPSPSYISASVDGAADDAQDENEHEADTSHWGTDDAAIKGEWQYVSHAGEGGEEEEAEIQSQNGGEAVLVECSGTFSGSLTNQTGAEMSANDIGDTDGALAELSSMKLPAKPAASQTDTQLQGLPECLGRMKFFSKDRVKLTEEVFHVHAEGKVRSIAAAQGDDPATPPTQADDEYDFR